ncbi:major facilitator superfamily domain-containing protein [Ditylenchus destructor]|uniref:Major facilitator superfamily domain-containing protein n=1 Tax=Ditylenchus destructor TaxID=166010 RepID=A0AAD4R142_9BILA|nr:major facilitator superfamily domain-containing protein [Ditylenchus destructor]
MESVLAKYLHKNGSLENAARKTRARWLFKDRYRYFILFLGFLCATSLSANMSIFNFTLICMVPPPLNSNATLNAKEFNPANPTYPFSENQKAILMWALAVGTLFSTVPFSALFSRFGARYVLFGACILSAISTGLFPLALQLGFVPMIVLRFLQGVAYASDFAALGMLCSKWASLTQHGLFLSVVSSYSPASSMVTNTISGMLCSSRFGWPMAYFSFSIACLLFAFLWLYFYTDVPQDSNFMSSKEIEVVNRGKSKEHVNDTDKFIPYKAILRSKLVWIVWLNAFADLCSAAWTIQYQPSYFKYVLNFSVEETGFLTSVPTVIHLPLKLLSGWLSDEVRFLSERTKMIICNTISVGLPGVAYLGITFSPTPFLAFLWFILNAIFFAPAGGGFYKCGMLCSRQYSHFVMANIQVNKCMAMFISPAMMYFFVSDITSREQWRIIFLVFALLCFVSSALFCVVATDEPEPFTKLRQKEKDDSAVE